jgi:hypothetical protein
LLAFHAQLPDLGAGRPIADGVFGADLIAQLVGVYSANAGLQYSRLSAQLETFPVEHLPAVAFDAARDNFQHLAIA